MKSLVLAATLAAAAAGAQPVYRCGNNYGTQPCAGAKLVEVEDTSAAADAARARNAAKIDMERARELERARLAQEKAAPKAIVMAPPPQLAASAAPRKPAGKKDAGKKGKDRDFIAVVPGSGKKKKK
jgi:hypothetical protein